MTRTVSVVLRHPYHMQTSQRPIRVNLTFDSYDPSRSLIIIEVHLVFTTIVKGMFNVQLSSIIATRSSYNKKKFNTLAIRFLTFQFCRFIRSSYVGAITRVSYAQVLE